MNSLIQPHLLSLSQAVLVSRQLEITTFTPKEVDWAWRLKKTMACAVQFFDQTWYVQFTSRLQMLNVSLQLRLRVQQVDVWIQCEDVHAWPDLRHLLQSDATKELKMAYLNVVSQSVWEALHHQTGQSAELIDFRFETRPFERATSSAVTRLGFDVYSAKGGIACHGCLVLDSPQAHQLAERIWPVLTIQKVGNVVATSAQHVLDWNVISTPLRLQLGYTLLKSADVQLLTHGDTILLDQKEQLLRVGANRHPICYWQWPDPSDASHEAVTVHFFKSNPDAMTQLTDATHAESLEQVQLQVRFELARWTATLAEIEGLHDGAILNLGQPIDGQCVSLWIDQQCIGHGRIVQVGDQVGVQVLQTTASAH